MSAAAAAVLLAAASLQDLLTGRISNRLILCGAAAGFFFLFWPGLEPSAASRLAAGALPVLLFWFLFRVKAFGAGDIKLMAALGLLTGLPALFYSLAAGFFAAAAAGIALLLIRRQLLSSMVYSFFRFREMIRLKKVIPIEPEDAGFHKISFAPALFCGCFAIRLYQFLQNLL